MSTERVKELEDAIRKHRSQKADDRCIFDDDELYAVLRDGIKCDRRVGDKADMLINCARFIEHRCEGGGWPSYVKLEERIKELEAFIEEVLPLESYYDEDWERTIQVGQLYTVEEFEKCVDSFYLTDYDGYGCWAIKKSYYPVTIIFPSEFKSLSKPYWATHVLWFNK